VATKTGIEYADDVRELRAQGLDFPASDGYILSDAANWSRGQKAAVTCAINQFDFEEFDAQEEAQVDREFVADAGLAEDEIQAFFDDGAGDDNEEWDDIDYFDFDEADDLIDDEADDYDEAT